MMRRSAKSRRRSVSVTQSVAVSTQAACCSSLCVVHAVNPIYNAVVAIDYKKEWRKICVQEADWG